MATELDIQNQYEEARTSVAFIGKTVYTERVYDVLPILMPASSEMTVVVLDKLLS